MKIINCSLKDFAERITNQNVILYGAGRMLEELQEEFSLNKYVKKIKYVVDKKVCNENETIKVFGEDIKLLNSKYLRFNICESDIIIITCGKFVEILELLKSENLDNIYIYIYPCIRAYQSDIDLLNLSSTTTILNNKRIIPKIIHYTWLSGEEIPTEMKKCIDSWKKYCPDYIIKEWNQSNYDIDKIPYVRQAVNCGKWGFAGDYIRLDVVYKYGGIYLDLDVEVIKNLDELLCNKAYASFESKENVNLGSGFGSVAGNPLLKAMMEEYENMNFIKDDGTLNMTASPLIQTKTLKKHGLEQNGKYQVVEGMVIYPFDYLCAQSVNTGLIYRTENTYTIHRFAASWFDSTSREIRNKKINIIRASTISDGRWE